MCFSLFHLILLFTITVSTIIILSQRSFRDEKTKNQRGGWQQHCIQDSSHSEPLLSLASSPFTRSHSYTKLPVPEPWDFLQIYCSFCLECASLPPVWLLSPSTFPFLYLTNSYSFLDSNSFIHSKSFEWYCVPETEKAAMSKRNTDLAFTECSLSNKRTI